MFRRNCQFLLKEYSPDNCREELQNTNPKGSKSSKIQANETSHLCNRIIFVGPSSHDNTSLTDVKRNLTEKGS